MGEPRARRGIDAAAIFVGAFLLFQVQLILGRYLLPLFGGAPQVWTTCMLFFQALLLAGYAYAHGLSRWLAPRRQLGLHALLLLAALVFLPIIPASGAGWDGSAEPTGAILGLLLATIGLPFLVLSASAPLLQAWAVRRAPDVSPYPLYAVSNLGSLLALLSYPLLVEALLSRSAQAWIWSGGFLLYAVLCAICGWKVRASPGPASGPSAAAGVATAPRAPRADRMLWVALAAAASLLLLAVTNAVSQDVAVVPILWVVPLSLYLLSFVLTFGRRSWYRRGLFVPALFLGVALTWWVRQREFGADVLPGAVQLLVYGAVLFACCMVCHGELHRLRPVPERLTGYYLALAVGGALGGLLAALVAPAVFADYHELPIGVLACAMLALLVLARESAGERIGGSGIGEQRTRGSGIGEAGTLCGVLVVAFVAHQSLTYPRGGEQRIDQRRSFFGVVRVSERLVDPARGTRAVKMVHGSTTHGVQYFGSSERQRAPTAYYGPKSGIGLVLQLVRPERGARIGVVGLGVGTLATYGRPGDVYRFYEIDPLVEDMARAHFRFLADAEAGVEVVLGDARVQLQREAPQEFDVLVLDAFSSDAVPIHLLTREALAVDLVHLRPGGVIAVHVSNRHLRLAPVVARLAEDAGLVAELIVSPGSADRSTLQSSWVLMAREPDSLAHPELAAAIERSPPVEPGPLWTDDHASLWPIVLW